MNRQLPPGCHLHAPSWDPLNADALAREVAIHRLPISSAKGRTPQRVLSRNKRVGNFEPPRNASVSSLNI